MPRELTKLRVSEVSSVDRGAGEGVRIMLMKRDAALPADVEAYIKREFSDDDRKRLAESGAAMKDGGYPIENKADLHNAVQAFGRAKDKPATRRHIIARARSLGAVDALPEAWKVEKRGMLATILEKIGLKKQASDFETTQANVEAAEYAQGMVEEFSEAIDSLQQSICSIMCDQDCTDKQGAIDATIEQYRQHVQGGVPEGIEQAMRGAALAAAGFTLTDQGTIVKGAAMTDDEKKKLEQDKAAEKDGREKAEKALVVAKREIAILKMSDKHKAYVAARGDDMKQDEKDKFADMEPAERDAHMDKHPVPEDAEKRIAEEVTKRIASDPTVLALKKRNDELAAAAELTTFTKRAVEIGLGESHGATIQKAYAGDKAAIDTLLGIIKGAGEQARTAGIFKEFGSSTGTAVGDDSAHAQLTAKAAELRKSDPKLSEAQAFAKVYQDPANVALAKRERAENRPG
jgi:hypothetical protein